MTTEEALSQILHGETIEQRLKYFRTISWGGWKHIWLEFIYIAKELGLEILWDEEIHVGDMYLAMRNTGPHLLTCREIGNDCLHPVEIAYSFDTWECKKVQQIKCQ